MKQKNKSTSTTTDQWQQVTLDPNTVNTARLGVGSKIEATLIELRENPETNKKDILMEDDSGTQFLVITTGVLQEMTQRGKLEVGCKYSIERLPNLSTPGGASRTNFKVLKQIKPKASR